MQDEPIRRAIAPARSTPESEAASTCGAYWPGRVAVNQTSSPDGAQASP